MKKSFSAECRVMNRGQAEVPFQESLRYLTYNSFNEKVWVKGPIGLLQTSLFTTYIHLSKFSDVSSQQVGCVFMKFKTLLF